MNGPIFDPKLSLDVRQSVLQLFQLGDGLRRRGRLAGLVTEAPSTFRLVHHCPYPKERPEHVQHEHADPAGGMDRVLVRVMARLGDGGWMSWIAIMP